MSIEQSVAEEYVNRGLLNRSVSGEFTLYCYSKETFFGGHWDDVTKSCRGLVFYKGDQINNPFPKIFNLDETPEVSYDVVMGLITDKSEEYVVCHKVNGHLTIVDYIPELDKFIIHTKGSLQDNEMNQSDREMFFTKHSMMISKIRRNQAPLTLMFESIHEDDKHTLYDQEVSRYGENRLVLLGGYYQGYNGKWCSLPPFSIKSWASLDNAPYAEFDEEKALDGDTINGMFKEIDTEGYVIWFPRIDLRVKIKTTDYWKMRFRKELTPDSIIDRFVSGGDGRLYSQYPEEIADKAVFLIQLYFRKYLNAFVEDIPKSAYDMERKDIGQSDQFTSMQKSLIFMIKDGKVVSSKRFMSNKNFRVAFKEYMDHNESYKVHIKDSLIEFIEKREV